MRTCALCLLALALGCAESTPVAEVEPPADGADAPPQVIEPDVRFTGSLDDADTSDRVTLRCPADGFYSMHLQVAGEHRVNLRVQGLPYGVGSSREDGRAHLVYHRLAAGDHLLDLSRGHGAGPVGYALEIVTEPAAAGRDPEPNADTPLDPAEGGFRGVCSVSREDIDAVLLRTERDGPWRLRLRLTGDGERPPPDTTIEVHVGWDGRRHERFYRYRRLPGLAERLAYPVLAAGVNRVDLRLADGTPADAWQLTAEPLEPGVDAAAEERIRAAIAAGLRALQGEELIASIEREGYAEAYRGLALAACCEGEDAAARLPWAEEHLVAPLAAARRPAADGSWHGAAVSRFGDGSLYEQSIAVLGLAEAATAGSERARELCAAGVDLLLASQQTGEKCAAWHGPVPGGKPVHGGWRYQPDAEDADLSVSGWCLVALLAADAAGIERPGLREALEAGAAYVDRCRSAKGFLYAPGQSDPNNIRNGIGGLVGRIYGRRNLNTAFADLDLHLPAGTQVDIGEDYPLYYAYYATRCNYLRSGRPWELWRTAMSEQLLLHQRADGTWPGFAREDTRHPAYTTALAVMILRLCLNQAPAYLQAEAKGF